MQRLGKKLRMLRKRHRVTLQELAQALGLNSHAHLSKIEAGKARPSLELMVNIAHFFKVSVDQLVEDDLEIE